MSNKAANTNPITDPCEAVIAVAVGQSLKHKGKITVKHVNEDRETKIEIIHIKEDGAHALRMALYRKVNELVDGYIDAVNGC